MKWGASLLIFLCFSCSLLAQSETFKHGESGVLALLELSKASKAKGVAFGLGYGWRGGPELGFNVAAASRTYGVGVHLGYDFSRRNNPVGLKLVTDLGLLKGGDKYSSIGGVIYGNAGLGIVVPSVGGTILKYKE